MLIVVPKLDIEHKNIAETSSVEEDAVSTLLCDSMISVDEMVNRFCELIHETIDNVLARVQNAL